MQQLSKTEVRRIIDTQVQIITRLQLVPGSSKEQNIHNQAQVFGMFGHGCVSMLPKAWKFMAVLKLFSFNRLGVHCRTAGSMQSEDGTTFAI